MRCKSTDRPMPYASFSNRVHFDLAVKHMHKMPTPVDPSSVDPQARFLEMKSLQPFSTTDEYLYAMKEDLADWLSTMYPEWRPITAESFVECLGKTFDLDVC